jgi:hypothetical protein
MMNLITNQTNSDTVKIAVATIEARIAAKKKGTQKPILKPTIKLRTSDTFTTELARTSDAFTTELAQTSKETLKTTGRVFQEKQKIEERELEQAIAKQEREQEIARKEKAEKEKAQKKEQEQAIAKQEQEQAIAKEQEQILGTTQQILGTMQQVEEQQPVIDTKKKQPQIIKDTRQVITTIQLEDNPIKDKKINHKKKTIEIAGKAGKTTLEKLSTQKICDTLKTNSSLYNRNKSQDSVCLQSDNDFMKMAGRITAVIFILLIINTYIHYNVCHFNEMNTTK